MTRTLLEKSAGGLLVGLGVRVALIQAEGLGILKCKAERV